MGMWSSTGLSTQEGPRLCLMLCWYHLEILNFPLGLLFWKQSLMGMWSLCTSRRNVHRVSPLPWHPICTVFMLPCEHGIRVDLWCVGVQWLKVKVSITKCVTSKTKLGGVKWLWVGHCQPWEVTLSEPELPSNPHKTPQMTKKHYHVFLPSVPSLHQHPCNAENNIEGKKKSGNT